jgi:hypothetical protein
VVAAARRMSVAVEVVSSMLCGIPGGDEGDLSGGEGRYGGCACV